MQHRVELRLADGSVREARARNGELLLDAVQAAGLPIARACGASGLCGRCGVLVVEGGESLSAESDRERGIKQRNRIDPELRLACCARVRGRTSITASYW